MCSNNTVMKREKNSNIKVSGSSLDSIVELKTLPDNRINSCGKRIRKKLWQIDKNYLCSIIGTCFTLDELRYIAKSHFPAIDNKTPDYELHSAFVCTVQNHNGTAQQCQKRLDKKYKHLLKHSSRLKHHTELQDFWCEAVESNDIAGTFWVLVTHPHVGDTLLQKIFGEVHMLSHISGASIRTDIKQLGKLRKEKQLAESSNLRNSDLFSKRLQHKQEEIDQLNNKLKQLKLEMPNLDKLRVRIQELENGQKAQLEKTVEGLSERLFTISSQLSASTRKYQKVEDELLNEQKRSNLLEREAIENRQEREAMEKVLNTILENNCNKLCQSNNAQNCAIKDLKGQHILYVGGRASQCPYFRSLVEFSNGEFSYHDGGKEDNPLKLNGALAHANTIVCPTDCVSHDAYERVKRHCEQQDKQLIMIPHASLSSFTKGLNDVYL